MSALDDIRRALTDAYGTGIVLGDETADDLIKAAVAEFDMDAQAYPGELAMLRGLVRTLRMAARWGCIAEVQKLLYEHAADDAAARVQEKSSPTRAGATPADTNRRATTRRTYLLAAIQAEGHPVTSQSAAQLLLGSPWPTAGRNTVRKDLRSLARDGFLLAKDAAGRRIYHPTNTGEDGRP